MKRRRKDSGFALLLVFLFAAIIGITLYMEIPRVAFNTQRQKEQLLIERGEQYKIAIRRFVQANRNRWPASMDELESFNNRHFLRHRYKDPMTGKDEWRLVHIQNGVLTDSKNQKNKNDQTKNSTPNTFIQEMAGLGTGPAGPSGRNSALSKRGSDTGVNMPGMTGGGGPSDPNNPNNPNQPPTGVPPYPGQGQNGMPGQSGYPGTGTATTGGGYPSSGGFIANQPGLGSVSGGSGVTTGPNGQPVYPGQQSYPGMPGMPVSSQTGGVSPYPIAPGSNGQPPGFGQPGLNPGQPNQAIGLINNILTTPRPGGLSGIQGGPMGGQQGGFPGQQGGFPGQQGNPNDPNFGGSQFGPGGTGGPGGIGNSIGGGVGPGGTTIGGGIAGVASNADEESIMVYGDHTNYSEWEFIFDPTKWHAPPNPNVGTIGTAASQLGTSANNLNSGIGGGSSFNSGIGGSQMSGGMMGAQSGGGAFGGSPMGGGQPGGQPGGQMGTGGMPAVGGGQFGGGGLPDIRPGRR